MDSSKDRPAPVIIVGAQRSGTTMLRLMLNSHPMMAVPFECDFLAPLCAGIIADPFAGRTQAEQAVNALANEPLTRKGGLIPDPRLVLDARPTRYADVVRVTMQQYAERRGKCLWAIKTPGYNSRLDEILALLPDARVIHIVRDGRDVAVSYRNLSWGSSNTPRVAQDWRWKVMLGRKTGRIVPHRYHELKYEDLVRAPEATLRVLCEFLNLAYHPAMLEYHRTACSEMPMTSLQWHRSSISPPDAGKCQAWQNRLPLADQLLFQEVAADALETFGYELVRSRARLQVAAKRAYYTLLQRW